MSIYTSNTLGISSSAARGKGTLGRDALLYIDGEVRAGVRTKTLTWGGESVDTTSSENDGVRLLLAASGQQQIDIPVEGITKDSYFLDLAMDTSKSRLVDVILAFDYRATESSSKARIVGKFRISSYEEGAPYNDAVTFSATLESTGAWSFYPESV